MRLTCTPPPPSVPTGFALYRFLRVGLLLDDGSRPGREERGHLMGGGNDHSIGRVAGTQCCRRRDESTYLLRAVTFPAERRGCPLRNIIS